MKTACWIGNDIVDLAEPGVAGKERDRRFVDRVFTPDERARILGCGRADDRPVEDVGGQGGGLQDRRQDPREG